MNIKTNRINSDSIVDTLTAARAPLTPADLAERLELGPDDHGTFNQQIEELERAGRIVRNRAGLLLVAARANLLSGQVQGHRDGFGFLIRDDAGQDLVLSEHEMSKVLHGDRVLARITGADRRGRPEGEIVEVIESRTNRLVGRLLNERGVTIVVPEDQRIAHDILIPPGGSLSAEAGQVVVVEILQQPQRYVQPVGRVVEVLGAIDDPGMEIEIAVRKFAVPHEFSDSAVQLAASLPEAVTQKDLSGRVDLRDVALVTIDGEDARDFDDAVYCEPIIQSGRPGGRNKGWRLIVAVADVSHYVQPGDLLDLEAQNRSTSVYFPRRVIPMLPEKLSNGLCSLKPEVDRLVMVCDCVVSAKGAIDAYQFYPAVMHSHARLTYDEVWEALSAPDSKQAQRLTPVLPHLQNLYALFESLKRAREARGAIDLDSTETYIVCDPNGRIEKIVPRARNDAHKLIEECMLAANVCTADFIERGKQAALYRVHEGPTPERLANVRTLLKTLSLTLDGGDKPEPSDYARLLKQIKPRPDAQLLQTVLLRSMQQAIYSPHNSGHFGLAYKGYTHFTSPIRRYPDLLVHRVIKAMLGKQTYVPEVSVNADAAAAPAAARAALRASHSRKPAAGTEGVAVWEKLGLLCSANERRADDASRDVEAWLKSYYMRERVGETYSGTVSSVVPFGAFIVLDDLYIEGLVHVSELGSEYFLYNEALHELRGERTGLRYRLGDRLTVQVARVDLEARRIDFRLVKGDTRKTLLAAGAPDTKDKDRKRGETVEERRARQAKVERRQVRRGQLHKIGKKGVRGRDSKVRAAKRGR
ncbi:MAG: ribonuclease R [Pseudomonadota bacterium]|nr:ribonuclease R [Pseudomonadota bacterium]